MFKLGWIGHYCFDAKRISNSVEKFENVINETALHLGLVWTIVLFSIVPIGILHNNRSEDVLLRHSV